jgi:murein L,D-transpeptidase YcbB/YkuD
MSLLCSLLLITGCGTGYYYVYQANTQLKPILPPLAAQRHLQQWLEHLPEQLMDNEALYHLELVTDIYRRTDYRLLWFNSYELSEAGQNLLQQLRETGVDELIDYHYHLAYLQQRLHNLPNRPKEATAIDILLTDAFIAYAEDVLNRKLLPEKLALLRQEGLRTVSLNNHAIDSATDIDTLNAHDKHPIITSLITENVSASALNNMMAELEPKHRAYQELRKALHHYQSIAASYQWWPLEGKDTLRQGNSDPQVVQLRSLLKLYGDYPLPQDSRLFDWFNKKPQSDEAINLEFFDDNLVESVKHFQQRHGLTTNGVVDKKTRALLNVSPNYRIKQIAFNMKRWRQLPDNLGKRYIWVNLTDFHLDVIDHGRSIMDMKVIVGKSSRRTPVMYENINSLVLNPQWNVPRRIMVRDILPKLKEDPLYLAERNIRIISGWQEAQEVPLEQIDLDNTPLSRFPYRLQQDPGEDNALGVVKFVIPNDDSIYLHDTNSPQLFAEHERALSSGCVRVEKPLELAELLLKGKRGWNRQKIDEVLAKGETTYVKLPEAIPTYLLYWTAWVDAGGRVQFRDDIYQEDKLLQSKTRDLESLIL